MVVLAKDGEGVVEGGDASVVEVNGRFVGR